jgi:3-hydroxyisobutyrate dehydrogenase
MRIGFVGLGAMGLPMFRNLAKKYPAAIAYDLSDEITTRLRQEGFHVASSKAELVDMDIVITMLPNGKAVRSTLFLEQETPTQLAIGLSPGGIVVDMSSSSPLDTARLAKDLANFDIQLADAPVSGSVPKANSATLSIMLGATDGVAQRITALLHSMGNAVIRTGEVGTAHAMKALNNYVYAAGLLAASEAMLMGKALNLNLETLVDVFNKSSGRNVATETKLKQHMLDGGDFKGGFSLHLMAKDLGITYGLSEQTGFTPAMLELCHQLWQTAAAVLPAKSDNLEIAKFLEASINNYQPV